MTWTYKIPVKEKSSHACTQLIWQLATSEPQEQVWQVWQLANQFSAYQPSIQTQLPSATALATYNFTCSMCQCLYATWLCCILIVSTDKSIELSKAAVCFIRWVVSMLRRLNIHIYAGSCLAMVRVARALTSAELSYIKNYGKAWNIKQTWKKGGRGMIWRHRNVLDTYIHSWDEYCFTWHDNIIHGT